VQKNKDLQQALSAKEVELYEIQRDMKSANENIQFLQERLTGLKEELKNQRALHAREAETYKAAKDKVLSLQESLSN
jgi:chromosome segregation ATPase